MIGIPNGLGAGGAKLKNRKSRAWTPKWSPDQEAHVEVLATEIGERVSALKALREALGLSQAEMADLMDTTQSNISKMESRSDVRLSNLRHAVERKGGRLRLVAEIGERELELPL